MSSNPKDNEQGDDLTDQPQQHQQQQQAKEDEDVKEDEVVKEEEQQQEEEAAAEEEQKQEEGETSGAIDDKGMQPYMVLSPTGMTPEYSTSFGTDWATDDDAYDDVNPSSTKRRKVGPPPLVIEYWNESTDAKLNEALKNKAEEVKLELEEGLPGSDVKINPELPMKDFNELFRVRIEGPITLQTFGDQNNPKSEDLELIKPNEVMLYVKGLYDRGSI